LKNKNTFFLKLFAVFTAGAVLLSLIFFIIARKYTNLANIAFFERELETTAKIVSPQTVQFIDSRNNAWANEYAKRLFEGLDIRITVIALDGKVLADSQSDPSAMANHANREEIAAVIGGAGEGRAIRYSSTLQKDMLYKAFPLKNDGKPDAVLRLSVPVKKIEFTTAETLHKIFLAFLFIVLASLAAAYFISKRMSSGIGALHAAATQIAEGDFKAKVEIEGKGDEIEELGKAFNLMSDKISGQFAEISEGKEMLDKVLASVSDAIVLIEHDGRTLLFNDAFKAVFEDAAHGKYFWEYLRSKDIEAAIEKAKTNKSGILSGECSFAEKIFLYSVSKVKNEDKFVISLKDITKAKQLDDLKKDFITNASHELKTPVTSIIGFAETLESESLPDESMRFVGIIKRQAQRMSNIVSDLLELSRLENNTKTDKKSVDMARIIADTVSFYGKKAEEKNISIKTDIESALSCVYADEFNMEQLMTNLVDNAVKYTEKGEIIIKAENAEDFVLIKISDTGIGIPKEHIPRLFERFYVVDKSRSKKSGGTGLGLSIVKHILQANDGSISVESAEGKGASFIVKLPTT